MKRNTLLETAELIKRKFRLSFLPGHEKQDDSKLRTAMGASWESRMACAKPANRDAFAPPDEKDSSEQRTARMQRTRAICTSCIVRAECLVSTMRTPRTAGQGGGGYIAGLSPDRRLTLRENDLRLPPTVVTNIQVLDAIRTALDRDQLTLRQR